MPGRAAHSLCNTHTSPRTGSRPAGLQREGKSQEMEADQYMTEQIRKGKAIPVTNRGGP
jgi:hypothetical protein